MRFVRAACLFTASALCCAQQIFPQASPQVKRVQADWQSIKSSRVSGDQPKYPQLAADTHIEGGVRFNIVIGTDGTIKNFAIISGHPLLAQTAIDTVRSWRFKPRLVDGAPAEVETIATVVFLLPGHDSVTYLAPFRKNVERNPNGAKEHGALGRQMLNIGEAEEAAAEFRKEMSLDPNDAGAHFNLADAMATRGDLETAISECRKGLSMQPNQAEAHFTLAIWLEKKGDLESASDEFRQGLQVNPKGGNHHYQYGLLLMERQEVDSAIAEYKLAMQTGFDSPVVHYELGRALEQKGDLAGASGEIQKALKLMPQNQTFREELERLTSRSHP